MPSINFKWINDGFTNLKASLSNRNAGMANDSYNELTYRVDDIICVTRPDYVVESGITTYYPKRFGAVTVDQLLLAAGGSIIPSEEVGGANELVAYGSAGVSLKGSGVVASGGDLTSVAGGRIYSDSGISIESDNMVDDGAHEQFNALDDGRAIVSGRGAPAFIRAYDGSNNRTVSIGFSGDVIYPEDTDMVVLGKAGNVFKSIYPVSGYTSATDLHANVTASTLQCAKYQADYKFSGYLGINNVTAGEALCRVIARPTADRYFGLIHSTNSAHFDSGSGGWGSFYKLDTNGYITNLSNVSGSAGSFRISFDAVSLRL